MRYDVLPNGCWLWRDSCATSGYPQIKRGGKNHLVHRLLYTTLIGQVPEGYHLHHSCRQTRCVNPHHLEIITPAEHRRLHAADIKSCPHGHEYTPANTYLTKAGGRMCRTCLRERYREKREREGEFWKTPEWRERARLNARKRREKAHS